ncbi:MAG: serine/threonine-protein kinase [Phycisphaerae bacterium]|nr:serine/threonine-protein kinase [Phycisphaerae bacterium]
MPEAGPIGRARLERLESVVIAALDLDAPARISHLDHSCEGDPELRREASRLLAHEERMHAFLSEGTLTDVLESLGPLAPVTNIDCEIGPYRLVECIGVGGMGEVYRAERSDGAFRQTVAMKLLRADLHSPELLERFRVERQVLADLVHPNITRLLDGGTDPNGRPYLVMEFIDATPITEYCQEHRLSTDARVRIFRSVCVAVQEAHRRLVVHCDLKPSNILVTSGGETKLMDFGIAHVMGNDGGQSASGDAESDTDSGSRRLSIAYASPEQVRGERATASTDVYALGIILRELLTGERPAPQRSGEPTAARGRSWTRGRSGTFMDRPFRRLRRARPSPRLRLQGNWSTGGAFRAGPYSDHRMSAGRQMASDFPASRATPDWHWVTRAHGYSKVHVSCPSERDIISFGSAMIPRETLLIAIAVVLSGGSLVHADTTYSWRYYRPGNTGIQGDYNEAVWVGPDGDPYIGGYNPGFEDGGFAKFVQAENRWINAGYPNLVGSSRVTDFVPEIGNGSSRKVWIATGRGARRFDPAIGPSSLERFGRSNSALVDDMVLDVDRAPDGTVWFWNPQGPAGQVVGLPGKDSADDVGTMWAIRTTTPGGWNSMDYRLPNGTWVG